MTLREQVVAEIMKLVRPTPVPMDHKPTIDELEKMLNSDSESVNINPDGTVSVQPPPCTVGDVADAVLRVFESQRRPGDNSLHAVRSERKGLRIAQSKAVMPLIGPLLDAWEGVPNDSKGAMREGEPALCDHLDKINSAMEDALAATDAP